LKSKKAIPIGPDLSLFKKNLWSEKGKTFPSFADRIPSKSNPAYAEYCRSQGISVNEENIIILLGTIGRRGPSSFIFEPVLINEFTFGDILRFRKQVGISRNEMAMAFDLNELTLMRIETAKSKDVNTLRRIQIYIEFPEVALWQLELTGKKISINTLEKLRAYLNNSMSTYRSNRNES